MKNIVFIGPPGCGKGTQSSFLETNFNAAHISTGDILRAKIKEEGSLAKKIKDLVDAGSLISDELIVELLEDEVVNIAKQSGKEILIFDGFPRTIKQAEALEIMLDKNGQKIDYTFIFNLSEEMLVKRITGRYTCSKCNRTYNKYFCNTKIQNICDNCGNTEFTIRADDNEEVVKRRYQSYIHDTGPVIEFLKKQTQYFDIDASLDVNKISELIVQKLKLT